MFKSFTDYMMYWYHSVEALKTSHKKDLMVKDLQIQELEKEILQLKKRRICYVCGNEEGDLKEFGQKMRSFTGFPSYFYCAQNLKCLHTYMDQLEGLDKS